VQSSFAEMNGMSTPTIAWTTAAATALICAVLAAAAAWLLMTEPLAITASVDSQQAGPLTYALLKALVAVVRTVASLIW
jgi:hypothetical protein